MKNQVKIRITLTLKPCGYSPKNTVRTPIRADSLRQHFLFSAGFLRYSQDVEKRMPLVRLSGPVLSSQQVTRSRFWPIWIMEHAERALVVLPSTIFYKRESLTFLLNITLHVSKHFCIRRHQKGFFPLTHDTFIVHVSLQHVLSWIIVMLGTKAVSKLVDENISGTLFAIQVGNDLDEGSKKTDCLVMTAKVDKFLGCSPVSWPLQYFWNRSFSLKSDKPRHAEHSSQSCLNSWHRYPCSPESMKMIPRLMMSRCMLMSRRS